MDSVKCQQCGGAMKKGTKTESSIAVQMMGVLVFLLGLVLLVFFPVGTLVGLILMIAAARMGYKKRKVWLCKACGYFFERA